MNPRNITKSLPKEQVERLIKRWHNMRQSGYTQTLTERRIGYRVAKMTQWAESYNLEFKV